MRYISIYLLHHTRISSSSIYLLLNSPPFLNPASRGRAFLFYQAIPVSVDRHSSRPATTTRPRQASTCTARQQGSKSPATPPRLSSPVLAWPTTTATATATATAAAAAGTAKAHRRQPHRRRTCPPPPPPPPRRPPHTAGTRRPPTLRRRRRADSAPRATATVPATAQEASSPSRSRRGRTRRSSARSAPPTATAAAPSTRPSCRGRSPPPTTASASAPSASSCSSSTTPPPPPRPHGWGQHSSYPSGIALGNGGYDRDRSGKIDSRELTEALRSLGYAVPPSVIELLIANYNNGVPSNGALDFDNFVECGMIVKGLTEKFKEKDTRYTGSATLTYDGFLSMVIPFIVP